MTGSEYQKNSITLSGAVAMGTGVMIGAGAKILGNIEVGACARIAAGSVVLRPVPALFLQGNRDVIFNLTEAYWNWQYFRDAGGDARLLSNEGAHMNPLANQLEGDAGCGAVSGLDAALGWLDVHLRGASPLAASSRMLSARQAATVSRAVSSSATASWNH